MQTSATVSVYSALLSFLAGEMEDMSQLERSSRASFDGGWEIQPGTSVNDVIQGALRESFVGVSNVRDLFLDTHNDTTFQFQVTLDRGAPKTYGGPLKVCGIAQLRTATYTQNERYSSLGDDDCHTFRVRTYLTVQWCLDTRE
jgi:hypothetical protein